jgi:histone-lysine N-methyltransferase SETDB1
MKYICCISTVFDESSRACSPLLIPIILGWQRQLSKHKNHGRRTVFYVAPCGRRLRNLEETLRYLR